MPEPELSEQDYLRQIELLALDVVDAARGEGRIGNDADPPGETALQRAVNALACRLRHQHFEGDGCVEDDRPLMRLGGAALIGPGTGDASRDNYRTGCARLGVDPRPDGWALWYCWDHNARAHTLVTTALTTTRALLESWARGRDVHPAWPLRSQVRAVARGWVGPVVLSPGHAAERELGGR
ncbi:hypothetical protein [Paractinoplanes globisporus]|uniref:Uncharacterized protein n=1 Tax=Paractinoplanes globisporus TaxID=113565 RepID=A0ABW6W9V6_9ACTN|nr:hypothetical protein [Actinoplanes globisporus]